MTLLIALKQKLYSRLSLPLLSVSVLCMLVLAGCAAPLSENNQVGQVGGLETGLKPLSFFPAQDSSTDFYGYKAFTGGGMLFFSPAEILLALANPEPEMRTASNAQPISLSTVRLEFVGASVDGNLHGDSPLSTATNIIVGPDPDQWQIGVRPYTGLRYSGIYPGIDLTLAGLEARTTAALQLKGTYHVAAGYDPDQIRWRYDGAASVSVESNGDLRIEVAAAPGGPDRQILWERAPVAWQEVKGQQIAVEAAYRLAEDGIVQFRLGEYDPTYPLVLDPTIEYGTFLGGSGYEEALGVAVDGARSVIVVGSTVSADYPSGIPLPEALLGTNNVIITKISRDGSQLDFSTILGGSGEDSARGVVVDSAGDIYLAGNTFSPDFPTILPGQVPVEDSGGNIFIVKLSLSGGTIRYSTTYGGSGTDEANAIAVDTGGSVVIGGFTNSEDFPLAAPVQATYGGGERDGFILRLNASGNTLVFSSYVGGNGSDIVRGIDVDRRGSIYITGQTDSIDFPTVSPLQEDLGGLQDAFITKLNPEMDRYTYSTYLGFGIGSAGNDVLIDQDGNAYVVGTMERTEEEGRGGSDAFVLRLNEDGSDLDINIVLGGDGDDDGVGIGLDRAKNVYVTGYTESTDLENAGTFQPGYGGDGDAFLAQLSPVGELVTYNYVGGSEFDRANAIEVIGSGDAVIVGVTFSADFPVINPQQRINRGEGEVFVFKIQDVEFVPTPVPTATPEATPLPPTATPVPTALESIVESDAFLYGLFGFMGFVFILLVIEVVRSGRRRR